MTRRLCTIALILLAMGGVRLWFEHFNSEPLAPHLERLPRTIGNWQALRDVELSQDTRKILRAESVLVRDYELAPGSRVQIFVAYYRNQHAGESMHSPRNCLPGSGWEQLSNSSLAVDMGDGRRETVNRYLVEKQGNKMLVVYWYQNHNRIIANEYLGKLYLMWDSIRHQYRDGAIIRITVPAGNGLSEDQATEQVTQFIRSAAPQITKLIFE